MVRLVIAEKPSVAASLAKVLGVSKKKDGFWEGENELVSWCVGHLVELASADSYDPRYSKNRKIFRFFPQFGSIP